MKSIVVNYESLAISSFVHENMSKETILRNFFKQSLIGDIHGVSIYLHFKHKKVYKFIDQVFVGYLNEMHFNYDMRQYACHSNLKEINAINQKMKCIISIEYQFTFICVLCIELCGKTRSCFIRYQDRKLPVTFKKEK